MSPGLQRPPLVALALVTAATCLVALAAAELAVRVGYFGWSGVLVWRYQRGSLISPEFIERDPLVGHRLKPGLDRWDKGYRVRTNALGFRDREHDREPAPGVLRIVVLGDSVAAGETVAEEAAFPRRVEALLDERGAAADVVNLAIPMTGTFQHARILLAWGRSFHPAMVLYGMHLNDVCDNPELLEGVQTEWLEKMLAQDRDPWSQRVLRLSFLHDWLTTRKLQRRLREQTQPASALRESRCLRQYPFAFELIKEGFAELRVAVGDVPLVLAILPFLGYLDGNYPFTSIHERITELATTEGFIVLDLLPAFRGRNGKDLWVYPSNSHPGPEGHEIIARAIVEFLRRDPRVRSRVPPLAEVEN